MKYFVIARYWDDEKKAQVKRIAGTFDRYIDAALFRDAYNAHYSAHAEVVDEFRLING